MNDVISKGKNAEWKHEAQPSVFKHIFPADMVSFMFLSQQRDTKSMFYLFYKITSVLRQNKHIIFPDGFKVAG